MSSARGMWLRGLALVAAFAVAAPVARADEASDAVTEASVARFSERLERRIEEAKLAAELARRPRSSGVIVTPNAILYMDGAEIPIDELEWADLVQARRFRRSARTDTVMRVAPGVTLSLQNFAGDIRVGTWDRDEVRIEADYDKMDELVTELRNAHIKLGVGSRQRSPAEVEWKLTVPAWLPLELSGIESEIELSGMRSSVRAQSMRGDIFVVGCQGPVEANSAEGEVHVTDVSGNVTAGSINNVVRILRVVGPVDVQTVNGDIQLEKVESSDVDASTVNGRVYFASGYRPRGRYAFSSHNGRLIVPVPKNQNVNVTVSSFQGQVESSMPVPSPAPRARGRAYRFTFRDGVATPEAPEMSAAPMAPNAPRAPRAPRAWRATRRAVAPPVPPELELESFGGLIRLASQEEVLKSLYKQRARLDSLRSLRTSARWRYDAGRRVARRSREVPPTPPAAPEAPTPPPQR